MEEGAGRGSVMRWLLWVVALVAVFPAGAQPRKPNVLLVLIDDLRPDLGIYGHPVATTPNIDALGRSGIVFDQAFTQQALCAPSRAALLTGLRPESSGIVELNQPVSEVVPNAITMVEAFRRAGYHTSAFGKVYHHRYDDMAAWSDRPRDAIYGVRQELRESGKPNNAAVHVADRDTMADTVNVRAAIEALGRARSTSQPFFMAVGIHRPHLPFEAPERDWALYSQAKVPPPVNPAGQKEAPPWALVSYEIWSYDDTPAKLPMPPAKADELRRGYLAAISYADGLVGELMMALDQKGLSDDTIVVLWGDHGFKLGDHGNWSKHSNANLDIHIPLIIRAPGRIGAGTRTPALVETVDVYPTLAELAGIDAPDRLDGLSMAPLLARPDTRWKAAAFAQYDRGGVDGVGAILGRTVRTARYRYTAWIAKEGGRIVARELYDLARDPNESANVAGDPAYMKALAEVEALRLAGWRGVRAAIKR